MSLMNYVDDTYVIDELVGVLRRLPTPQLSIAFPAGTIHPEGVYPEVLVKSVNGYASQFEEHLRSHNVDPEALQDTVLTIEGTLLGMRARISAQDIRGKSYAIEIAS